MTDPTIAGEPARRGTDWRCVACDWHGAAYLLRTTVAPEGWDQDVCPKCGAEVRQESDMGNPISVADRVESREAAQIPVKRKASKKLATKGIKPESFLALCKAHGIPEPLVEYQFAPPRKWRFDFCWNLLCAEHGGVALEIQGGLFVQGRHSRGAALLKEHEKLNAAAIREWRVLFCTPQDVKSGAIFRTIREALRG